MSQELHAQTGYAAPVNELQTPGAPGMHAHSSPGEMQG
jgi:hypothetical protein